EVRIDEGRRDEIAGCVDHAAGLGLYPRLDRGDRLTPDADVGHAAVGKRAALDDDVEAHLDAFMQLPSSSGLSRGSAGSSGCERTVPPADRCGQILGTSPRMTEAVQVAACWRSKAQL